MKTQILLKSIERLNLSIFTIEEFKHETGFNVSEKSFNPLLHKGKLMKYEDESHKTYFISPILGSAFLLNCH